MGIHFDALVEFTKSLESEIVAVKANEKSSRLDSMDVKSYLEDIIRRCSLFECHVLSENIKPEAGKDDKEFDQYLKDFFTFSKSQGKHIIMPVKITAIEDQSSVVIFDEVKEGEYLMTVSGKGADPNNKELIEVVMGYIVPKKEYEGFRIKTYDLFQRFALKKGSHINSINRLRGVQMAAGAELKDAAVAFINQNIYIMDPENFILKKENNASIKDRQRAQKRKSKAYYSVLRKTCMRPHFMCVSVEDLRAFLNEESVHPFSAHPVSGHWRNYRHERFKQMQGQVQWIDQYFTGDGNIIAREGWNYTVMIKQMDPPKVVPYTRSKIKA